MVMIVHQAESVDDKVVLQTYFSLHREPYQAIGMVQVDGALAVTSRRYVIKCAWKLQA